MPPPTHSWAGLQRPPPLRFPRRGRGSASRHDSDHQGVLGPLEGAGKTWGPGHRRRLEAAAARKVEWLEGGRPQFSCPPRGGAPEPASPLEGAVSGWALGDRGVIRGARAAWRAGSCLARARGADEGPLKRCPPLVQSRGRMGELEGITSSYWTFPCSLCVGALKPLYEGGHEISQQCPPAGPAAGTQATSQAQGTCSPRPAPASPGGFGNKSLPRGCFSP